MSHRNYSSHDDGRRHTDPSSSRFNSLSRYHQRGGGRGMNRPVQIHRPTNDTHDLRPITVSLGGDLLGDRSRPRPPMSRGRFEHRDARPRPGPRPIPQETQARWWRVSIPQIGLNNKERMMSTLRAHCIRQFQPYHVSQCWRVIRECHPSSSLRLVVFHRSRIEHGRVLRQ